MALNRIATAGAKLSVKATSGGTFTQILGMKTFPAMKRERKEIDATAIDDTTKQYVFDPQGDSGSVQFGGIRDFADAGQILLAACAATNPAEAYYFQIELNNKATPSTGHGTQYTFQAYATMTDSEPKEGGLIEFSGALRLSGDWTRVEAT